MSSYWSYCNNNLDTTPEAWHWQWILFWCIKEQVKGKLVHGDTCQCIQGYPSHFHQGLSQTTQYNVAMRGSLILCTMSLLPSQPKPVPIIHLGWEEQVIKCLAQGHNTQPVWGSDSRPQDLEFRILPLSYCRHASKERVHCEINRNIMVAK